MARRLTTAQENTKKIVSLVNEALTRYSEDEISVDVSEACEEGEINEVVVSYHSTKNSFPIHETGIDIDDCDTDELEAALDELDVGWCF